MEKIPVLLTSFIRPKFLSQLLDILEKRSDIDIYFASDGPRNKSDQDKINECLGLFQQSKFHLPPNRYMIHNKNYGTKFGLIKNIDWFFSHNEYGIVLEDDCKPNDLFFESMKESLLTHIKSDRYMMVSGSNYLPENENPTKNFYRESYFPMVWGWASWANKWSLYKLGIPDIKQIVSKTANKLYGNKISFEKTLFNNIFTKRFSEVNNGILETWDYSLMASMWRNNLFALQSNFNMVKNIGFGKDAAHTTGKPPKWVPKEYVMPLKSIQTELIDEKTLHYDRWLAKNVYNCNVREVVKNEIKRMVGR